MIFSDDEFKDVANSDLLAAPSSTGVGMTAAPNGGAGSDALPPLTGVQKAGRMLYNFGQGFHGQPTAEQQEEVVVQRRKQQKVEQFKQATNALEDGFKIMEKLPDPEARAQFAEQYAAQIDKMFPGTGEAFKNLSKQPDQMALVRKYAPKSASLRLAMEADPSGKSALSILKSPEGLAKINAEMEASAIPDVQRKVRTMVGGWQQMIPPEMLERFNKDKVITASEFHEANEYIRNHPEQKFRVAALDDGEMGVLRKNEEAIFSGVGVLTGKKEEEVIAARAKESTKPTAEPKTEKIGGKVYQWDPDKKVAGTRLSTDDRYVELGATEKPGKPGALDRDTVNVELKLSDDYRQDTKKFAERRPLFESATSYMAERGKNKTSAGDAALMYAYAKARDPNDRLAVSETKDLVKLGNIFERFGVSVVGILEKGETLPDRVAKEMYTEIRRRFTEDNRAQTKVEKEYTDKVRAYGGDPTRVVRQLAIAQDQLEGRHTPAADGQQRKKIGNVTYVKKNGQWYEERP